MFSTRFLSLALLWEDLRLLFLRIPPPAVLWEDYLQVFCERIFSKSSMRRPSPGSSIRRPPRLLWKDLLDLLQFFYEITPVRSSMKRPPPALLWKDRLQVFYEKIYKFSMENHTFYGKTSISSSQWRPSPDLLWRNLKLLRDRTFSFSGRGPPALQLTTSSSSVKRPQALLLKDLQLFLKKTFSFSWTKPTALL